MNESGRSFFHSCSTERAGLCKVGTLMCQKMTAANCSWHLPLSHAYPSQHENIPDLLSGHLGMSRCGVHSVPGLVHFPAAGSCPDLSSQSLILLLSASSIIPSSESPCALSSVFAGPTFSPRQGALVVADGRLSVPREKTVPQTLKHLFLCPCPFEGCREGEQGAEQIPTIFIVMAVPNIVEKQPEHFIYS